MDPLSLGAGLLLGLLIGASITGVILIRRSSKVCEAQARLEAERDSLVRANQEKLAAWEDAEKKLREAFQSLSAEALNKNNQSFLDLA
ncbi:MAG: DNA recombination protein RmuC, partial [Planctomycetes bacterium]|nr:DNA recombination protein RmuC [Planctomycetota bacterium]